MQEIPDYVDQYPASNQQLQNTRESQFLSHLVQKSQIQPLNAYFQNDFYLNFKSDPQDDDLSKRVQIFAKVYIKNQLIKAQNKIVQHHQQRIEVTKSLEVQQSVINLPKSNSGDQEQNCTIEEQNEINIEIKELSTRLIAQIENLVFDEYQKGNTNKCVYWKQRREEIEHDMQSIQDREKLLQILKTFKHHYQL